VEGSLVPNSSNTQAQQQQQQQQHQQLQQDQQEQQVGRTWALSTSTSVRALPQMQQLMPQMQNC